MCCGPGGQPVSADRPLACSVSGIASQALRVSPGEWLREYRYPEWTAIAAEENSTAAHRVLSTPRNLFTLKIRDADIDRAGKFRVRLM